jgi:hypothetical protein
VDLRIAASKIVEPSTEAIASVRALRCRASPRPPQLRMTSSMKPTPFGSTASVGDAAMVHRGPEHVRNRSERFCVTIRRSLGRDHERSPSAAALPGLLALSRVC